MFEYLYVSIKLNFWYIILLPVMAFFLDGLGFNNVYTFTLILFFFLLNIFSLFKNLIYLYRAFDVRNKTTIKIKNEMQNLSDIEILSYIDSKEYLDFSKSKEKKELTFFIKEIIFNGRFNEKTIAQQILKKEEDIYIENFNLLKFFKLILN